MVDKRLEDLRAELVQMVETGNEEIAAAQQHLNETLSKWGSTIEQQRGRIAEREYMLDEHTPKSNASAPVSDFRGEMVEALKDAARNGA